MPNAGQVGDEMAAMAMGGAILTFTLFPFAVPMIALTLIALLPLLVAGLAVGLVLAALATPVVVVRRLRGPRPVAPAVDRDRARAIRPPVCEPATR